MKGRGISRILVPLLVLTVTLSGCTSGGLFDRDPVRSTKFLAFGEPESAYGGLGFGYNASEVAKMRIGVSVDVSDAEDLGVVVVGGLTDTDQRFYLRLETFNATQEYQDGGIAANLRLHGATGNGDSRFPGLDARMAGWGNATMRVEDMPYPNPVTGQPWWSGAFFVLDAGVHDDASHAIRTSDGAAAYDPARPHDVAVDEEGREILVVLWTHEGTWDGPAIAFPVVITAGEQAPIADLQYDQQHDFFNTAWGTSGVFAVEMTTQAPTMASSELSFRFESPSGKEVETVALGGVDAARDNATVQIPMDELGTYRVRVTGEAAAITYRITGQFDAADPITATFHWEDTLRGKKAQAAISEWKLAEAFAQLGGDPPPEPGDPIAGQVEEVRPPRLNVGIVLLGVAGVLVAGLLVVKLVLDSVKAKELKETYQKDKE